MRRALAVVVVVALAFTTSAAADIVDAPYVEAHRTFAQAMHANGEERARSFRRAAELYAAALKTAPARDEAPEAAMNGAYAYEQIGDYRHAIALCELFVAEYGSAAKLASIASDPKRLAERVRYLGMAHEALEAAYAATFDFAGVARHADAVARDARFPADARRNAARNAVVVHAMLREHDAMTSAVRVLAGLSPSAEDSAAAALVVASWDLATWNDRADDEGENRRARLGAERDLSAFYDATSHAHAKGAETELFEAACSLARLSRAGGEPGARAWADKTRAALARLDPVRADGFEQRAEACTAPLRLGVVAALAPRTASALFAVEPP